MALSTSLTPPLSVPMRFFLTAPLFGMLACLVLISYGPQAMASRWTVATLAVTHLMTLGYITMTMIGALSQLLPVLIGSPLPRPTVIAPIIHISLSCGVFALAIGFLLHGGMWIQIAMVFLGLALFLFTGFSLWCLLRAPVGYESTRIGMILAVILLMETVILGLNLATGYIWGPNSALPQSWTNAHLTLGLIGWVCLLLISVAYVVVPMFQVTPNYPNSMKRWLHLFLLTGICLWLFTYLSPLFELSLKITLTTVFSSLLAMGLILFSIVTLVLQSQRRVRQWDVTIYFWRFAMLVLLVCALLWLLSRFWAPLYEWPRFGYFLGILFLIGFVVSVINGMLYKIVPFLVWLHLQNITTKFVKLPKMRNIISNTKERRQLLLHLGATILFVCAVLRPGWFLYPAALFFLMSSLQLWLNIFAALRLYQDTKIMLLEIKSSPI